MRQPYPHYGMFVIHGRGGGGISALNLKQKQNICPPSTFSKKHFLHPPLKIFENDFRPPFNTLYIYEKKVCPPFPKYLHWSYFVFDI